MPDAFPPDPEHSEDDSLAALTWEEDELAAVMQAVEALDEGDEGIELNSAFDQLRRKHGIRIESTIKWTTSTDAAT